MSNRQETEIRLAREYERASTKLKMLHAWYANGLTNSPLGVKVSWSSGTALAGYHETVDAVTVELEKMMPRLIETAIAMAAIDVGAARDRLLDELQRPR